MGRPLDACGPRVREHTHGAAAAHADRVRVALVVHTSAGAGREDAGGWIRSQVCVASACEQGSAGSVVNNLPHEHCMLRRDCNNLVGWLPSTVPCKDTAVLTGMPSTAVSERPGNQALHGHTARCLEVAWPAQQCPQVRPVCLSSCVQTPPSPAGCIDSKHQQGVDHNVERAVHWLAGSHITAFECLAQSWSLGPGHLTQKR